MDKVWEIIIAGLGLVIACLQYRLSEQINRQDIIKEKGYFILEETNLRKKEAEDYKRFVGLFDLNDPNNPLHFRLYGNGDIFLLKEQIIFDGDTVKNRETFFNLLSRYF